MKHPGLLLPIGLMVACTKPEVPDLRPLQAGRDAAITINEVMVNAPGTMNELGEPADVLELYNAGRKVMLPAGEWFITDDPEDLLMYELPELTLDEADHLLIWCDGENVVMDQIHASFQLAVEGEWLALVHRGDAGTCIVDAVRYPSQEGADGLSFGRSPDGTQAWTRQATATIGGPNEGPAAEP